MNLFGISKPHFEILTNLVIDPLKKSGCEVWIFGSRAKKSFQEFSDIDVLYKANTQLDGKTIYKIKSEIEESNLPYKVDIVNIEDLADSYKADVLNFRIKV